MLFEVSTDKVDSEVPSPGAGVLAEIRVPEGETVDVGTVLAVVGDTPAGGAPPLRRRRGPGGRRAGAGPRRAAPRRGRRPRRPTPADAAAPAAPQLRRRPPRPPRPARRRRRPAPTPATATAPVARARLLSPIVRRLVTDHGLDIARIEGTGPGGRITRSDVERAIDAGDAAAAPAPAAAPSPASPAAARGPGQRAGGPGAAPAPTGPGGAPGPLGQGDTSVPLNRIRRITGEHMVMSKATSPHVLTAMEVDFEGVEQVRRAIGAQWRAEEGFTLTYLPFIARATCDAIRDFPYLNASVGDGELVIHGYVNLGIAVDLNFEGLVAPVVRGADGKRLRAIAREIVDLADPGPLHAGSTPTTSAGARSRSPTPASTGR